MTPVEITDPAILDQIYRLRVSAWRARTQHFPDIERWTDAHDATANHWAILEEGQPVAAARLTIHGRIADAPDAEVYVGAFPEEPVGPVAVLSRLIVAPAHARRGFSRQLDLARLDKARRAESALIIGATYAGPSRQSALRDLGFTLHPANTRYADGPLAELAGTQLHILSLRT